ncbi:general substrate transporter [Hesseltinella vesiculosa]|uniref:General substrate transporter n=1 Tax=Hesseltinella vesiculosa TaxID=101127 RepID=A0A1X2G2P4_9FUNG|nr:general substrate transporter [Hesseltinella vesiculosa]
MVNWTKITTNVYVISLFASLGGITFGFDIGSNSGIIGTTQYLTYFDKPSKLLQGGINGSLSAGCFVGALFAGAIADRIGRKYTLIIASALFVIGSLLQSASNGVPMLCVGRVVNGISVGFSSMVIPLYQSEVAPKEIRGRLVAIQQWAITWGIFLAFWIQTGFAQIDGTGAFRGPWAIQAIPALILLGGLWFFPFSPRWLADQGRMDEAIQVLADIHGNGDVNHPRVQEEIKEIQAVIDFDKNVASHRYADLFKPRLAYRVFLGVFLQIWQQLTGMNIIMFYVVLMFKQAGIGGGGQSTTLIASGVNYVVNVVMTVPAILFVDKWGRRPTLIAGAFFMSLFLWLVGGLMKTGDWYIDDNPANTTFGEWVVKFDNDAKVNAIAAMVYLFVGSFATTWGPLGWIYPAEIYPLRVRAMAVSLSTAANWLFNWVLSFMVPYAMQSLRYGLYMLFAGFNFLMMVHVYLAYPETKGYTLEEMDIVFECNPRKKMDPDYLAMRLQEKLNVGVEKLDLPEPAKAEA